MTKDFTETLVNLQNESEKLKQEIQELFRKMNQKPNFVIQSENVSPFQHQKVNSNLLTLNQIHMRIEEALNLAKELDRWESLPRETDAYFETDDYEKVANRVDEAIHAAVGNASIDQLSQEKMVVLDKIRNKLEAQISPLLRKEMNELNLTETKKYFIMFRKMRKEQEFWNYFKQASLSRLGFKDWKLFINDCTMEFTRLFHWIHALDQDNAIQKWIMTIEYCLDQLNIQMSFKNWLEILDAFETLSTFIDTMDKLANQKLNCFTKLLSPFQSYQNIQSEYQYLNDLLQTSFLHIKKEEFHQEDVQKEFKQKLTWNDTTIIHYMKHALTFLNTLSSTTDASLESSRQRLVKIKLDSNFDKLVKSIVASFCYNFSCGSKLQSSNEDEDDLDAVEITHEVDINEVVWFRLGLQLISALFKLLQSIRSIEKQGDSGQFGQVYEIILQFSSLFYNQVVLKSLVVPIHEAFKEFTKLSYWSDGSGRQQPISAFKDLVMPNLSIAPTSMIHRVGEYLLGMVKIIDDELHPDPTIARILNIMKNTSHEWDQFFEQLNKPQEEEEIVNVVQDIVYIVSLDACNIYIQNILVLEKVSLAGSLQLFTDLDYFSNVLKALGVDSSFNDEVNEILEFPKPLLQLKFIQLFYKDMELALIENNKDPKVELLMNLYHKSDTLKDLYIRLSNKN